MSHFIKLLCRFLGHKKGQTWEHQGDNSVCKRCGVVYKSGTSYYRLRSFSDASRSCGMVAQSGCVVTCCHYDRTYRRCLCCVCGEIHICTPSFGFYTTDDHGEGLVCERCFHEYLGHRLNAEKRVTEDKKGSKVMSDKPKTRAEEIAYDVGVKDGRHGQDKCPYITEPFAQYWRDGHAQGKAEGGCGCAG